MLESQSLQFGFVAVILLIELFVVSLYWRDWASGQRIYACILVPLLPLLFLITPYRHPKTGVIYWRLLGNAPQLENEKLKSIITDAVGDQIPISEDFEFSVSGGRFPKHYFLSRVVRLLVVVFAWVTWYSVPPYIDRLIHDRSRLRRKYEA